MQRQSALSSDPHTQEQLLDVWPVTDLGVRHGFAVAHGLADISFTFPKADLAVADGYAAARGIQTPVPVYAGRDVLSLVREAGADTIAVCGSASAGRVSRRLM